MTALASVPARWLRYFGSDRKAIALQALMNQRRREEDVQVTFSDREPGDSAHGGTPTTPEEMSPPALPAEPDTERAEHGAG